MVTDATSDDDLRTIGAALVSHKLLTGGSGIALGLPENFRIARKLSGKSAAAAIAKGPAVVLSGSCSTASLRQVAAYLKTHPGLALDPAALMDGTMTAARAADWIARRNGDAPIVYSTADPASVSDAGLAAKIEHFFVELVTRLADGGARRIVVGGGETSGAVVEALGVASLGIAPKSTRAYRR